MRSAFAGPLRIQSVDGTAIANTTDETIIFPNLPIGAEFMHNHRRLRIEASGKLSTTGTPTIIFRVRWGGVAGTLLAVSETLTNGSGVANVNWRITGTIQCRADGATGKLLFFGELKLHTAAGTVLTNVFSVSGYDAPAEVTADVQAAADLSLTAQWSAASSSNTLTGMDYCVEAVN